MIFFGLDCGFSRFLRFLGCLCVMLLCVYYLLLVHHLIRLAHSAIFGGARRRTIHFRGHPPPASSGVTSRTPPTHMNRNSRIPTP